MVPRLVYFVNLKLCKTEETFELIQFDRISAVRSSQLRKALEMVSVCVCVRAIKTGAVPELAGLVGQIVQD